ncbi:MAG: hypothetical protein GX025_06530, partial [Clostridiales bacterium]|nr:hypothetical protein [Clostridiales bacterium]
VSTAQGAQAQCVNHLEQRFNPPEPNQVWVSDITYVRISGGFASVAEVKMAAFQYIEGFYNSRRPHSANKMLTPNEKEAMFRQNS